MSLRNEDSSDVHMIIQTAQQDLFAAALMLYAVDVEKKDAILENDFFIKLLNRCVTGTIDMVEGMDSWMKGETGTSAFETPCLLHLLVAVSVKHYNYDVLVYLTRFALPSRNIFTTCLRPITAYLESSLPAAGWDALERAGWVPATHRPRKDIDAPGPSSGALSFVQSTVGGTISSCVRDLPSSSLRSYFCHIPRTLYTNIPPYPRWPGDPVLIKLAASRTGVDGLEVLRLLVEIGGMDVNDDEIWWKEGDHDPRDWNPSCHDGSDCTETALHIAVDKENIEAIEYLLTHGAKRMKDRYGRDQKERAKMRGVSGVLDVFEKYPHW
ncbi:hypothetical protein AK830_g245 [Neonectria ditissima]|uniref:Uncharacterized protein n=1 Tax=Neonectria ditissima TaxID=78410 RepID=A0A0P7BXA5_9HYPO|nr:hypothetical protein AK830_g245 [Neonectria ditissima]